METLDLIRVSTDEHVGTFGVLQWRDQAAPFAVSLEDPWRDNQKNVSCIPTGVYQAASFDSPTHGPTWQIMDVPNRTYILLHKGNTHVNTQGCVLVAENYTFLDGIPGVGGSKRGFDEFMRFTRNMIAFEINIYWACDRGGRDAPGPFVTVDDE